MRTTFARENEESQPWRTNSAQNLAESPGARAGDNMRFPKKLRYRGQVWARIYAKRPGYPFYRLVWRAHGKRYQRHFPSYALAVQAGERIVRELAQGSAAAALTAGQARDALAAWDRLQAHFTTTGRRVSLLAAVTAYVEAAERLQGRPIGEAVDFFLAHQVVVKRVDLAQAVEEFIAAEGPRAVSPKYAYNRAIMLRRFAETFPNTALCDLSKGHLDMFFAALGRLPSQSRNRRPVTTAKARNHQRAVIRQFLAWAVRKDYLPATHRLAEADGMRPEPEQAGDVEFYTPAEFKALLEAAGQVEPPATRAPMRALIAIGGLAGLRTAELLRLTWEDTRRVEGHIEITAGKAKTRQRRLVEIVPALAQWLAPYAERTGKIWTGHEITFHQHFCKVCAAATLEPKPGQKVTVKRKANGLRHAFCTYHLAAHGNENATALQAGTSPQMLFRHYRGLAKKSEAEQWFAVAPQRPANVVPLAAP